MNEQFKQYFYVKGHSLDAHTFHEGKNYQSYKFLGAHLVKDKEGRAATRFVVWAPNAQFVNLVSEFNDWNEYDLPLARISGSGVWGICVYDVEEGQSYKYRIVTADNRILYKADPYAFYAEVRPNTASRVYNIEGYQWNDAKWRKKQKGLDRYNRPMSIYEVNLSSWRFDEEGKAYSYERLEKELVTYVKESGFTHVEFMPLTEYPYEGSWGYQVTGFFAATSRFGEPKQLMSLIDAFHAADIGVILDWVPVHFCRDDHGLREFDGSQLYEKNNPYIADNPGWGTLNFDYYKPEVRNFLISSALFWHEYFHVDGLRVDAVSSLLYIDFGGKQLKNYFGGRENLEAIQFIEELNTKVYEYYPDTMMIAEESTAWPLVTAPIDRRGLGFGFKWNMGWMHDTLDYFSLDPIMRRHHHNDMTFSITYCFSETYVLPFSHDEVVHMKGSLLNKMSGSPEEKFQNLRILYAYQMTHPGKKLLFMGGEFATFEEWNEWTELSWSHLDYPIHQQMAAYHTALNFLYQKEEALWSQDTTYDGFEWLDVDNSLESVLIYQRIGKAGERVICAFNLTPVERQAYPIAVDDPGTYRALISSDDAQYGGQSRELREVESKAEPLGKKDHRITVTLPPLSAVLYKLVTEEDQ